MIYTDGPTVGPFVPKDWHYRACSLSSADRYCPCRLDALTLGGLLASNWHMCHYPYSSVTHHTHPQTFLAQHEPLRRHGFLCDYFHQPRNWVVAAGWSPQHLANDPGRRNRLFLGHIQFSFPDCDCGVSYEGELCRSCGDLNNE